MPRLQLYTVDAVSPVVRKLRFYDVSGSGTLTGVKLRVYKTQLTGTINQPKLRFVNVSATGATSGSNPKVRWFEVASTASSGFKLQLFNISANSVTVPAIAAFGEILAEPLTVTSVTAVLAPGSVVPDDWSWRQISESTDIQLVNVNSQTVQFVTPSPMPSESRYVTLGVTAFSGGLPSTEVIANITVFPQLDWTWDGTRWVGSKVNAL